MSKGKKWNTPARFRGKTPHKRGYRYKVGGKDGKFKLFRNKKKLQPMMWGKVGFNKIIATEISFWD